MFSDLSSENRFIREIIHGKRGEHRYWQIITTDRENLPGNSTWYVMSKYPNITHREVGNFYGLRTWVEYGLKQSKNELGWADYRFTRYEDIERWWEIVCSAYLMVSLHSESLRPSPPDSQSTFASHPWWDNAKGWKNILNNLRLVIQPFILFNLIASFPINFCLNFWKEECKKRLKILFYAFLPSTIIIGSYFTHNLFLVKISLIS